MEAAFVATPMTEHRDRPPLLPAADEAISDVTEHVHAEEISLVWFLYADHGGIIRGKAASGRCCRTA